MVDSTMLKLVDDARVTSHTTTLLLKFPLFFAKQKTGVCPNRRKGEPENELRHNHGIVRGPIANDKVNFVVEDCIKGKITAAEAIVRVKALPSVMQVSLHTLDALKYLDAGNVLHQMILPNGEWSEWQGN
jgi:hypothetical protein